MIRTHSEDKIPRTEEMQDYAVKRLVLRMASLLDFETGEYQHSYAFKIWYLNNIMFETLVGSLLRGIFMEPMSCTR